MQKKKKMKNLEILDFLSKDEYYSHKSYNKKIYRPLEIFDGLDISSLDSNFYKKWRTFDWYEIFSEQYFQFYEKILTLIKDLKYFNTLFKLCDISKTENQCDFHPKVLQSMQEKFMILYKNYNPEKHKNVINDLKLLIFYSDTKNVNIKQFLTDNIQKSLFTDLVNKTYFQLLSEYGDIIDRNTKRIIINFFLENKNNINPDILFYLISKCPKKIQDILKKLNIYCIKKNDFFKLEESDNYKVFKYLFRTDVN